MANLRDWVTLKEIVSFVHLYVVIGEQRGEAL